VHLLFDFDEVFLSERLIAQEFVEKACVDWRTDAAASRWDTTPSPSGEQSAADAGTQRAHRDLFP